MRYDSIPQDMEVDTPAAAAEEKQAEPTVVDHTMDAIGKLDEKSRTFITDNITAQKKRGDDALAELEVLKKKLALVEKYEALKAAGN